MNIRVLIVDDHTVLRQALRILLETDPVIQVVGEAANGIEAVKLTRELRPEVVLMDLVMPEMDGIKATTLICHELPNTKILALTGALEGPDMLVAMRAGAIGYLRKDRQASEVCQAIKAAVMGQVQLSPEAVSFLVHEIQHGEPVTGVKSKELTQREIEVLSLVSRGYSNKQIAATLTIVEGTVKTYVSSIMAKLGVASRMQAVIEARRLKLLVEAEA